MNRIILHIDMNSYFASVEQQANPFLRGKPIGVTGKRKSRSVIAAASREAKMRGAKTAMSTWEALRICPDLVVVQGDPEKYSEITHRFLSIFKDFTHLVEQFSIDEAFLDVTDVAKDYLGAILVAQAIKHRLKEECGEFIQASIGIAPNKFLAKLASEAQKPDGLTVVRPEEVPVFLHCFALDDFCGIGPRIFRRLKMMHVDTVADLQACPIEKLIAEFKSYGYWLHEAAHGRDESLVLSEKDEPKTMGHSYTVAKDIYDPSEMRRVLLGLAEKVAWRLRRDEYVARSITGYVRYNDFTGSGSSHRFLEPTDNGLELANIAWAQIEKRRVEDKPIRLIGLSAGTLAHAHDQVNLFNKPQKIKKTLSALDKVRKRYGDGLWTRASLLGIEFQPRSSGFHFDHEI